MKNLLITILLFSNLFVFAQKNDKQAFALYKNNKETNWKTILKECAEADIVFFGEFHDNPIHHWLQYELVKDLYEKHNKQLVLGAEMFEADNQLILDEYLQDFIRERNFQQEARLWPNYKTDYKPLVEFAKKNNFPFIATNIPRRYAAVVNHGGFEALEKLPAQSLVFLPPLPIEFPADLPSYQSILQMGGMGAKPGMSESIAKAQASKDATMAWFILKNLQKGNPFIHFNGAFHSDNHEGIVWYVNHYNKNFNQERKLKIIVIAVEELDDISSGPKENKGDFIILTPSSMTKTH